MKSCSHDGTFRHPFFHYVTLSKFQPTVFRAEYIKKSIEFFFRCDKEYYAHRIKNIQVKPKREM